MDTHKKTEELNKAPTPKVLTPKYPADKKNQQHQAQKDTTHIRKTNR